MANVIRLKIGGMEYSITSDDEPAYIRGIASEVERKLRAVQEKSPFLPTTMAAIVTALECMDEKKKAEAENEQLRLDIKKLLEETACAKLDSELYRRKLAELGGDDAKLSGESDAIENEAGESEICENLKFTIDDPGDLPF